MQFDGCQAKYPWSNTELGGGESTHTAYIFRIATLLSDSLDGGLDWH